MKSLPPETESIPISEFKDKKILVVDDNSVNRQLLVHILKSKGAHILTAENGEEALRVMHEQSPHLVLMDAQMPVMDGYEATRLAKANLKTASIPIIALTGGDTEEEHAHCRRAGYDGYLPKPYSQQQLFEAIIDFLQPDSKKSPEQISPTNSASDVSPEMDSSWILRIARAIQDEYLPQLRELLAEDEPAALRRFGHTMKGLGRQFQLNPLTEWGDNFEKSAETLPSDARQQQVEQFETIAHDILEPTTTTTMES
ncbi:response regulator [bacterium]|nr:response regulator [bacterium]